MHIPGTAVFLYQYGTFRIIPVGGKHSEDPDPTYFGESVGKWDGNTFVIESVAFKGENTWADENADPHSDALPTVERWNRPDVGHLNLDLLIEDPKYYKEPIHFKRGGCWRQAARHGKRRAQRTTSTCFPATWAPAQVLSVPMERGDTKIRAAFAPLPPKSNPAKTILPPGVQ